MKDNNEYLHSICASLAVISICAMLWTAGGIFWWLGQVFKYVFARWL